MVREGTGPYEAFSAAWSRPARACLLQGDGLPAIAVAEGLANEQGGIAVAAVCDYQVEGPFAGVSRLLHGFVAVAEREGLSELVTEHIGSLAELAPSLARKYQPRLRNLSVSVPDTEALRTFTHEWATRHVNGVVDFLFALQDRLGGPTFSVGLVDLDQAGTLAGELLFQLARRGVTRHLTIWASSEGECPAGERLLQVLPVERLTLAARGPRPPFSAVGAEEGLFGEAIRTHMDAGEPSEAARLLERASIHCARRGFATDAVRYAERWLDLVGPGAPPQRRVQPLLQLVSSLLPLGDAARAEAVVKEALACPMTPRQRARCLYMLAMLHTRFLAERNLDQALTYIDQALHALGPQPEPDALAFNLNGKALILLRQGRVSEAGECVRKALADLEAQSDETQYRLQKAILLDNVARVAVTSGAWEEAIACFTRALAFDPHYTELYQERGTAYQRLGRHAEAVADFNEGIRCGPPSAQLTASRGNVWLETGRPDLGVLDFTRAFEIDDTLAYALKGRALCHYDLGQVNEALADYNAYLTRRPTDDEALSNRGSLRHDLGDREGALADLTEAIRINHNNVAALVNRAVLWADMGRPEEALRDLDAALLLDPGNSVLAENRKLLLAHM